MTRSAARRSACSDDVRSTLSEMSPTLDVLRSRACAALRTFFRLAEDWGPTADEQRALLGQPAKTTFYRWRQGETGAVTVDLMERLSHVLAIYGALHGMYLEHERADAWVRRPNDAPLFGGRTPLEHRVGGRIADLYEVRATWKPRRSRRIDAVSTRSSHACREIEGEFGEADERLEIRGADRLDAPDAGIRL
jgi:hypothetical protein